MVLLRIHPYLLKASFFWSWNISLLAKEFNITQPFSCRFHLNGPSMNSTGGSRVGGGGNYKQTDSSFLQTPFPLVATCFSKHKSADSLANNTTLSAVHRRWILWVKILCLFVLVSVHKAEHASSCLVCQSVGLEVGLECRWKGKVIYPIYCCLGHDGAAS